MMVIFLTLLWCSAISLGLCIAAGLSLLAVWELFILALMLHLYITEKIFNATPEHRASMTSPPDQA